MCRIFGVSGWIREACAFEPRMMESGDALSEGINRTQCHTGLPLLSQVLHSGFITHSQLFEFLRLDYCVSSRNVFNNRVLRLVNHRLLVRHDLPLTNRESVYSISEAGASELVSKGECYVRTDRPNFGNGRSHLNHALDLNEIQLALKRTGTLVYWTPETEIRSRNDLTANGYWKYYDAVVVCRLAGQDCKFHWSTSDAGKRRHYVTFGRE